MQAWGSWEEWLLGYEQLYCLHDEQVQRAGLDLVAVWRCRGSLPLSIESTSELTELQLLSRELEAPPSLATYAGNRPDGTRTHASQLTEHNLRLMYAMAITRLVNGVVDPKQQKARAAPVSRLAMEAKMPVCLVEIRHEATHNALPSLPLLKLAAEQALLWLHAHYWQPQRLALACDPLQLSKLLSRLHAKAAPYSCDVAMAVSDMYRAR
uniref:Uncharacterized protein n=1 Tax=Chrysotila carterae TaxID=13221 RepID=A0A7S4BLB4_CHRCT